MCGIAGAVDLGRGPVDGAELQPLVDALKLRGPDDEGLYCDGKAALGHRRLSIIDLEGGHQPMASEDGEVVAVLNGEIYNFRELRGRLEPLGHVFRTRSDSEVLVHGYEQWGDDVVDLLDGMFAFAVWDRRRRRLLLGRDRFGKKPLLWFRESGRFVFASTLTALLRHAAAPRRIDRTSFARYLLLEFVPAPASMVTGVQKLDAGCLLALDQEGHVARHRYWRLPVEARGALPTSEAVEDEVRARIVEAVRKRLVADVPLGIFLSGGIDSSTVLAAAERAGAGRLKTFSIGFDEPSFDESGHAAEVARRLGAEPIIEKVSPAELLAVVPRLGEILDEPMADASIVPTYLLAALARRHVKVALGGDGGDELFAGYPTYLAHRMAGWGAPLLAGRLGAWAARLASRLPVSHRYLSLDFKLKKMLGGMAHPPEVRNYVWLGALRPEDLAATLGREVPFPGDEELWAPVAAVYREAPGASHLERVLYQDVRLYLAHEILTKVDRASMACSLEVRAPLLDRALAEYVARLPLSFKLSGLTGKVVLRRAVTPWLPRQVIARRKQGFAMPIGPWLRGPLAPLAAELLDELGRDRWLATGAGERLLVEHRAGRIDHRKAIWTLMVFALWRRAHAVG